MNLRIFPWFFAFLALCLPLNGQGVFDTPHLTPSLVSSTTAVEAAKPFKVGVHLKMDPGWHTYWRFGGDSGMAPRVDWELPEGFRAGPIEWPLPKAHLDDGDLLTYIYEDSVLLLVDIIPPAQLPASPVTLKANLRWLACKETCVPGNATVSVALPTTGPGAPDHPELFAQWTARLPAPNETLDASVAWSLSAKELTLEVSPIQPGTKLEFFPLKPSDNIELGHPKVAPVEGNPTRQRITLPFETTSPAPGLDAEPGWQGLLVIETAATGRKGWMVRSQGTPKAPVQASTPQIQSADPGSAKLPQQPSLWSLLWGAFLGGLILNLMPCVLPVIALKIFGFVQQAGEAPQRVFRLGLAFVAGVFAFFLGLAALVLAFKSAGLTLNWGFQFQNPYLLAGLIALVFGFALSMLGVFEITLGSGTATTLDQLSRREGYAGAFAQGMFTTLLGTSCTAPILGPVLGFAFAQPGPWVVLIFALIAAGMSLPYFLLTWHPGWMRFLPKPGAWMERLKQLMGFILLGVALWLLGILGHMRGVTGMISQAQFLLAMGCIAWIYGLSRNRLTSLACVALLAGSWTVLVHGKLEAKSGQTRGVQNAPDGIPWQPFSRQRLEEALSRKQPVFIDFTAEWCINCKYNERVVIDTEPVRKALREKGILAIKADWTEKDPEITEMLKSFGRSSVPAYLFYPGKSEPEVLPEILTQTVLLNAFSKVAPRQK
jgi:thiol:disulfide interchange protein/DsbC/DsbD-like thiol-disulfide interchange protein